MSRLDIIAIKKTLADEGGLLICPLFESGLEMSDEVVTDLDISPTALVYLSTFGDRMHAFNITSVDKVRDEWLVSTPPGLKLRITNLWLPEHHRQAAAWKASPERSPSTSADIAELLLAMSVHP